MRPARLLLPLLGILLVVAPAAWGAGKPTRALPPVPAAAREDLMNASEVIEMLLRRPDKAAGSGEWDVVIERLERAQQKAPQAPQILLNLGLAEEMRGRNLAAISWLTAAWWAVSDIDPHLPQVSDLYKRIGALNRKVDTEIDLLLHSAKDELPYIHTTVPPKREWEDPDLFPSPAMVQGDHYEELPNGQWELVRSPAPEVSKQQLEEYLLELELASGYYRAIVHTVEHCQRYYPGEQSTLYQAHYRAFRVMIDGLTKAEDWARVSSLASDARRWTESQGGGTLDSGVFEKARLEANERLLKEKPHTKVAQWVALAKQQSVSDDELLLDAKMENLRRGTKKDAPVLEGIARALLPIASQRQRQSAVTSIYSVGSWD